MVIKKICKIKTNLSEIRKALPPLPPLQQNFCHCICVAIFVILNVHKTTSYAHKTTSYAHKTTSYAQKLQVTRSKLTSLTAETSKFQLTNMLFITF